MRSAMVWNLKCWPEYFAAVASGAKPFEVRKDDRPGGFQVGDHLELWEFDPCTEYGYTGRKLVRCVNFVLRDFPGLAPGYVCMGIAPI